MTTRISDHQTEKSAVISKVRSDAFTVSFGTDFHYSVIHLSFLNENNIKYVVTFTHIAEENKMLTSTIFEMFRTLQLINNILKYSMYFQNVNFAFKESHLSHVLL